MEFTYSLNPMQCTFCTKIMRAPFLMCTALHFVCSFCKTHCNAIKAAGDIEDCSETELDILFFNKMFENMRDNCQHGCGFRGKTLELSKHEISCYKLPKQVQCVVGECDWRNTADNLIKHVNDTHPKCAVVMPIEEEELTVGFDNPVGLMIQFDIDYFVNEVYWLRLYQDGNQRYVTVQWVGHIGPPVFPDQKYGEFKISSLRNKSKTSRARIIPVTTEPLQNIHVEEYVKLKPTDITAFEGSRYTITWKNSNRVELSIGLKSVLDCCVCMDIMRGPVMLCRMGHSVCGKCADKLIECPTCNCDMSGGRNYVLERLVEKVTRDCEFKAAGCRIVGTTGQMEVHAKQCVFQKTVFCYDSLSESTVKDFIEHKYNSYVVIGKLRAWNHVQEAVFLRDWTVAGFTVDQNIFFLSMSYGNDFMFDVFHLNYGHCEPDFYFDIFVKNSVAFTRPCKEMYIEDVTSDIYDYIEEIKSNSPNKWFLDEFGYEKEFYYYLNIYKQEN